MGALHINGQKATGLNITLADGVFIDTENVITSGTLTNSGATSYTATEDCYFVAYSSTGDALSYLIDNVSIIFAPSNQTHSLLLKKGQTLTVGEASTYNVSYVVYGIQQGTIEGKLQPVIYSEEEREVGVWTDGKPLYEKTIINDNPTYIQQVGVYEVITSVDMSDMDMVFLDNTIAHNQDGSRFINDTRTDLTAFGYVSIRKNNNDIYLAINTNAYTEFYYIIRYTKTTDTPGAGTWTPDGAYAHHYSTDEKVVGTYEGETLYERNIDISLADSSDMQTFAPGTLGIGPIKVIIDSYFKNSNSQQLRMSRWYGNDYWSYIIGSNGGIMIKRNTSDANWTTGVHFVATVQYTKSS